MSIISGQQITANDLNESLTGSLSIIRTEASVLPSLYWVNLKFDSINSTSPSASKCKSYIFSDDFIMEEAYLSIGNMRSAITASFDGLNMLNGFIIAGSGSTTNTFYTFNRYFSSGSQPTQVTLKGTEMNVSITTNYTGSDNAISVGLGLRAARRID